MKFPLLRTALSAGLRSGVFPRAFQKRRIVQGLVLSGCLSLPLSAQTLLVESYGYANGHEPGNPNDSQTYFDHDLTKLTDGVASVDAWGSSSPVDAANFAGWFFNTAQIRFDFGRMVDLQEFTVWAADSDGAAGVVLPHRITLLTDGGFEQVFSVVNPPGFGATVALAFSGFSVTTNQVTLSIEAPFNPSFDHEWLMLTEVGFAGTAVPEPSTYAALAGLATLGFVASRRRLAR